MHLRVSRHWRLCVERMHDEDGEIVPHSLVVQFDRVLTRKEFERAWKCPQPYRVFDMSDVIKEIAQLRHADDLAEMPAGATSGVAPAVRTRGTSGHL